MNITLDYLTGNRKWLVRDYLIWGTAGALASNLVLTEASDSQRRIIFAAEISGGESQVVEFKDLIDHRDNQLPETIKNPAIVLIPRNDVACFVIGAIGQSSFRLAKSNESQLHGLVDMLILEMN